MFSAKNFTESKGGVNKVMEPGTYYCRIVDIMLDKPPYDPNALSINFLLEGVDQGDSFEGMQVDRNNPSAGNFRGQIATVKASQYPFSTYTYQGREILRDEQIFKFITAFAKQMGVLEQIISENPDPVDTIEEYISMVARYLINPELWGFFTIAGEEYERDGYTRHRLFFPKLQNKKYPYVVCGENDATPENFQVYDVAKHIVRKKKPTAEPVAGFESNNTRTGIEL